MNTEADSAALYAPGVLDEEGGAVERRLYRFMCGAVAVAVVASLFLAPWRVTSGLLLGGVLAIVNYAWVRSSVRSAFALVEASGARPRWSAARYFLRYFFLAAVVGVAYTFDLVSLVAVLLGLCAFAAAGMLEGSIQLYLAIINRKDA